MSFTILFLNLDKKDRSHLVNFLHTNLRYLEWEYVEKSSAIDKKQLEENGWDLIIVSEPGKEKKLSILNHIACSYITVPLVFFQEEGKDMLEKKTHKNNATDVITKDSFHKILPIIKRENAFKKQPAHKSHITKELFTQIINLSSEEVFLFHNESLLCLYANQTTMDNTDWSKVEKLTPSDIFAEYSDGQFKQLIQPLIRGQRQKISICTNIRRKSGDIYPSQTHLQYIQNQHQFYILASNKDISTLRYKVQKLNRQRSLSRKYIRQNNQKREVLANAAHDMRTTINSIILSNKFLSSNQNETIKRKFNKFSNAIHYSCHHLLNYIDEFFDLEESKNELTAINREIISIRPFITNLHDIFDSIAQKNELAFNLNITNLDDNSIKSNPTYLKRILKNLLSNAFKYTEEGSIMLTAYSPKENEREDLNIVSNNLVAFSVKDSGVGIPKSNQSKIFDRYSRANASKAPESEGSGLGLDICNRLTDALGGQLKVESEVGKGSTFTLYIPVGLEEQQRQELIAEPSLEKSIISDSFQSSLNNATILIVDDSIIHNIAVQEYLSYTIDSCLTAKSPGEAKQILKNHPVDCVVLDYMISGENSLPLAKSVKENATHSDIPVIIYTGKKLSEDERNIINQTADATIKKSTGSYNQLLSTIATYIDTQ